MKYVAFAVGSITKSGIVKVVTNIANALKQETDIKIAIICTDIAEDPIPAFDKDIPIFNLNCPREKKLDYFRAIKPIRELAKRECFDTIVVSGMKWVLFYYWALKGLSTRMFAWEHRNFKAGPKFRLEWIGKRLACRKAEGIICITKRDYQYYRDYAGNLPKLHQIYNLVEFSAERSPYDVQSHKIISCGYLDPIKGFDMLMEVARKLLEKRTDWTWDIYGEGSEREHLEQLITEYGLAEHVFLKGFCADINQKYGEYSMFVMTSRSEGLGMVLIEAQKAGLPIVAFDIDCGPSDVVAEGENGYLIPPFDVETMVGRIMELQDNSDLRKAFSHLSESTHKEFEHEEIIRKWNDVLKGTGEKDHG